MRRGAAITGTVKAGGKAAKGARIVAANTAEQSFEVKANSKGQFALGGLPAGNYSVFTYDRTKRYVGKSLWVPRLKAGRAENVAIKLTKKAGRLLVDLYAGSAPLRGKATVTVVSRANGQFWSANVQARLRVFAGSLPGPLQDRRPGRRQLLRQHRRGAWRQGPRRQGRVRQLPAHQARRLGDRARSSTAPTRRTAGSAAPSVTLATTRPARSSATTTTELERQVHASTAS